jgi:hypothetical protein
MGGVNRRVGPVLALVLGAVLIGGVLIWRAADHESGAQVVTDTSASEGWKTIEYRGVRVDIPADWQRSDFGGCEFQFERWAPKGGPICGAGGDGVAFYVSAIFDPMYGPGIRRGDPEADNAAWAGYAYAGATRSTLPVTIAASSKEC